MNLVFDSLRSSEIPDDIAYVGIWFGRHATVRNAQDYTTGYFSLGTGMVSGSWGGFDCYIITILLVFDRL